MNSCNFATKQEQEPMNYLNPHHIRIQKVTLLATAFLVFWIYLGSLINFHQHHIFGRTLISTCIVNKREETVLVSHEKTLPFFLSCALLPEQEEGSGLRSFSLSPIQDKAPAFTAQSAIYRTPGLRAPPFFV